MSTGILRIDELPDGNVVLTRRCPFCGKDHSIVKPKKEYEAGIAKLHKGVLLQNAFPTWSPSERELIKTGICDACWSNI